MLSGSKTVMCLVHFGMDKTVTTSIQDWLYSTLNVETHYYLDLGSANASDAISSAFLKSPWLYPINRKLGLSTQQVMKDRAAARSRLQAELAKSHGKTAILSGEGLSRFEQAEVGDLHDFLTRCAEVVKAVGYVRAPKSFIESNFQQCLKAGSDVMAELEIGGGYLNVSALYPRYRWKLEKFDAVFGRENVALWKFEPKSFPGGCVVRDFCERIGIAQAPGKITRSNESLSAPAVAILYAYRKYGPSFGVGSRVFKENRAIIRALRQVAGPRFCFSANLIQRTLSSNREDIYWVEDRLGASVVEPSDEHGDTAVESEEDLFRVDPEALNAFLTAFISMDRRLRLPTDVIRRLDGDPRTAARAVQACREAYSKLLVERGA